MAEQEQAGAAAGASKQATVRCGVYGNPGPYAGKSIGDLRRQLSAQLQIPADAKAYKGKSVMDEGYIVQPGDDIQFHRMSGEKGEK